jgi:ribosome-binding factor A
MKQERRERIDHELQRELARLIATELKDPRLGFVTVTRVDITDDMQHAKVFVSIIGDRHVARQSMDALESAGGFLRGELGHAVRLRFTPDLTFIEDRSTEQAIALSKTLAKIVPAPIKSEGLSSAAEAMPDDK